MFSRATIGISQPVNKHFLRFSISDSLRDYKTVEVKRAPALQAAQSMGRQKKDRSTGRKELRSGNWGVFLEKALRGQLKMSQERQKHDKG